MAKDYYRILGVPLDAAPDEIRFAFRKLVRRHHPDRRGEPGARKFHDISEAYDVLSDPARRAKYDREAEQGLRDVAGSSVSARPGEPEPLVSDPVPLTGRPELVRPSFEALFERIARNFAGLDAPKAEHEEPLNFELILSPEEAERGMVVPFEVPVFSVCYQCAGMGRDWLFPCGECSGEGRIVDRDALNVEVPAGVRDGTVIELSLESFGIHNLWLRIHVRIEGH